VTDQFDNISDLFDNEEEVLAEETPVVNASVPGVYIALPGADLIFVPISEGMNIAQALDAADITLRATDQSIWLDGQPAGLDTVLQPGATITAVGRAKGG
jgi:hypothetical protein